MRTAVLQPRALQVGGAPEAGTMVTPYGDGSTVLKMISTRKSAACLEGSNEVAMYDAASALQGRELPHLLNCGTIGGVRAS